jgi:hypothetical protein
MHQLLQSGPHVVVVEVSAEVVVIVAIHVVHDEEVAKNDHVQSLNKRSSVFVG